MIVAGIRATDRSSPAGAQRVTAELQAAISGGVHAPGSPMPGKTALAREHGASPDEVHRALSVLRSRGYLRRDPDHGMRVVEHLPAEPAPPEQPAA